MTEKLLSISKYRQPGENKPYYYTFPHRNPTEYIVGRTREFDSATHKKLFIDDKIKEREYSLNTMTALPITDAANKYIKSNNGVLAQQKQIQSSGGTPSDRFNERLAQ